MNSYSEIDIEYVEPEISTGIKAGSCLDPLFNLRILAKIESEYTK